eukprot:534153_1
MSKPPSPKRRKLNNGSCITTNNNSNVKIDNDNIDLDGILSLAEALSMERQCFISLLKYRANINLTKLLDGILKIQSEQTSIVTTLKQCFEIGLNSINSLKEINKILNTERNTLLNLFKDDIVNDIVNNINNKTINSMINNDKCYKLMSKRIVIIQNLIAKNRNKYVNKINQNENKNDNNNDDDDID